MRGLSAHPGKMMVGKPARGFESLAHRQIGELPERPIGTVSKTDGRVIGT